MTNSLSETLSEGRVGIILSSAFFGFYAHSGFVQALKGAGVKGSLYAGCSAGALVAGFAGADGLEDFIPKLIELRRKDFWDPTMHLGRPWGLLKGHRFLSLLEENLPVQRLEDCPTPTLMVSTDLENGTRRVDTTGALAPAIAASCALPILFRPLERDGRLYADGGIIDKAPIEPVMDRYDLDALLVHIIHSRSVGTKAPRAPRKLLNWSLDVCRSVGWRTQVALAEARGIPTYVVETAPSSIGPFSMKRGASIMDATRTRIIEELNQPASMFRIHT